MKDCIETWLKLWGEYCAYWAANDAEPTQDDVAYCAEMLLAEFQKIKGE